MTRAHRSPHVHVVIATGDGRRSLRLVVPRLVLRAGVVVFVIGTVAGAAVITDYASLRTSHADTATLAEQLVAQQDVTVRLRSELDEIRSELTTWSTLERTIASVIGQSAPHAGSAADDDDHLAGRVRRSTDTLRTVAGVVMRAHNTLARLPLSAPVRASIHSGFGPRRGPWSGELEFHRGLDIAASEGAPVRSPGRGLVVFTGNRGDYGLAVILDHGADVRTLYGHLSQISVRTGEEVERGQLLGRSGSTGRVTGAHLHYEVLVAGRPVDPRAFISR